MQGGGQGAAALPKRCTVQIPLVRGWEDTRYPVNFRVGFKLSEGKPLFSVEALDYREALENAIADMVAFCREALPGWSVIEGIPFHTHPTRLSHHR